MPDFKSVEILVSGAGKYQIQSTETASLVGKIVQKEHRSKESIYFEAPPTSS